MSSPAISIQQLTFHYKDHAAPLFNEFGLAINEGERFGLFGPNGAGKTTLIHLMTGVLRATKGSVLLFGNDISAHPELKRQFGVVPQFHSFYPELSPVENLDFFGAWAGLSSRTIRHNTTELLEILGLTEVRHQRVATFSGGMKGRVNLAIGVIHKPKILFLDEPTNGVDVQTRHAIVSYLKQLNREGTTLVYTSHLLSEAESLCTQVALLDNGQLLVQDELHRLLTTHGQSNLESLFLQLTGKAYRDS